MKSAIQSLSGDSESFKPAERDRALAMGLALQLAARSPHAAPSPLSGFAALALNALQVGQMRVYVNERFECVGYVIWAMLTPELEDEYISGDARALASWEFSDGTNAWILEFAVAPDSLLRVLGNLRDVVFKEYEHVTYYRFKGQHRLCKRISRSDRTSFIAAGRRVVAA